MSKIGLFYGSSTSHTDYVAYDIYDTITAQLGADAIAIHNVGSTELSEMLGYDYLILGIPTWDIGQLQADGSVRLSRRMRGAVSIEILRSEISNAMSETGDSNVVAMSE